MSVRYASVTLFAMILAAAPVSAQQETKPAATSKDDAAAKKKEPLKKGTAKDWHRCREQGLLVAGFVLETLEANDAKEFPGIAAWLADYKAAVKGIDAKADPATWPMLDVDALVANNPHFWQAYYEIAPGDPGLAMLHGGLLHLGGEASRGSYVVMAYQQRPGIPKALQHPLNVMVGLPQQASKESLAAVMKGIKLYDEGKYDEALKLHEEALEIDPQHGFAHYEWGLTARQRDWAKAGIKAPMEKVAVNDKKLTMSSEVVAAFARARQHDPFQWKAYQGDDPVVIESFMALGKQVMPNMEKLTKARPNRLDDDALAQLAAGCQGSRNDELALVFRSAMIARRGRYAPEDHPFITKSLRRLAPCKETEAILARLAGPALKARQIVAPEAE